MLTFFFTNCFLASNLRTVFLFWFGIFCIFCVFCPFVDLNLFYLDRRSAIYLFVASNAKYSNLFFSTSIFFQFVLLPKIICLTMCSYFLVSSKYHSILCPFICYPFSHIFFSGSQLIFFNKIQLLEFAEINLDILWPFIANFNGLCFRF